MAISGLAPESCERKTFAGGVYLNFEFEVFVQNLECGDPTKPGFHQSPLFEIPNKLLIPLKLFYKELQSRCISHLSEIAVSMIHAVAILIDYRVPLVYTVFVKKKSHTRESILNRLVPHSSRAF